MNDFETLSELIHDNSLICLAQNSYGHIEVKLEEPDCNNSQIIIRHIPEDALVIKIDSFPAPSNIFKGKYGECKRADFGIIVPSKQCILIIEMKRTKEEATTIEKQLWGAFCCMEYYKIIGKTFLNNRNFLDGYKLRFISIGHTGTPKRQPRIESKAKKNAKHDTPKTMLKVDWAPSIHFNRLASLG